MKLIVLREQFCSHEVLHFIYQIGSMVVFSINHMLWVYVRILFCIWCNVNQIEHNFAFNVVGTFLF